MKTFEQRVREEVESACSKHGPINSVHEGYSVILEEVDEFWDWVKMKRSNRDPVEMLTELVQIAAMAQRTAQDVVMPQIDINETKNL